MTPEEREQLKADIQECQVRYAKGAHKWTVLNQAFLYTSIALSGLAVLFLKLEFLKNTGYANDMAALCAGFSAIISSIVAAGGFNKRWKAYRTARTGITQLEVDILDPQAKSKDIRIKLKEIEKKLNDEILG